MKTQEGIWMKWKSEGKRAPKNRARKNGTNTHKESVWHSTVAFSTTPQLFQFWEKFEAGERMERKRAMVPFYEGEMEIRDRVRKDKVERHIWKRYFLWTVLEVVWDFKWESSSTKMNGNFGNHSFKVV